jgi:hypothetical protein
MSFDYPRRAKVTLTLLIALILVSDIYFAVSQKIFNTPSDPSYDVALHQKRFQRLQERLPRRGLLGYLGDKSNAFEDASVQRAYYMAQYILSPLVIANTAKLSLVVGNFYDTESQRQLPKSNGLMLLTDFGNGVQLLRGCEGQKTCKQQFKD